MVESSARLRNVGAGPLSRPTFGREKGDFRRRSAYTLLELVLAMSLVVIVLAMIGWAIQIHFRMIDKSRGQVEQAQLMRALLQRIAEDIRNAVPFTPSASSATGATSSGSDATSASSGSTSSGSTSSSSTSSGSLPSTGSDSGVSDAFGTSISGGLYGSAQELQVETTRQPKPTMADPLVDDPTLPSRLSNIRTITWSLGDPGTGDPTQGGDSSGTGSQTGLYRRDVDRAEFIWANQEGSPDSLPPAVNLCLKSWTSSSHTTIVRPIRRRPATRGIRPSKESCPTPCEWTLPSAAPRKSGGN